MASHAAELKASLPVTITELINSDVWKGGNLTQLDNEIVRPSSDDCVNNFI